MVNTLDALELNDMPEVKLFRVVIAQAFNDACAKFHGVPGSEKSPKSKEAPAFAYLEFIGKRDEARKWLLGDSEDFRHVCTMAMFEPDAIRDRANELRKQGWPTPARERLSNRGFTVEATA